MLSAGAATDAALLKDHVRNLLHAGKSGAAIDAISDHINGPEGRSDIDALILRARAFWSQRDPLAAQKDLRTAWQLIRTQMRNLNRAQRNTDPLDVAALERFHLFMRHIQRL